MNTQQPAGSPPLAGSVETGWAELSAFYYAASGPDWENKIGWPRDAPLEEWTGVTTNGRVTRLLLGGPQYKGKIPKELGNLSGLNGLRLDQNHLSGCLPINLRDELQGSRFADSGVVYCP